MLERKDKMKNKAKVLKETLKNPQKTQREIAKSAGVSKTTVHNNLKELDQNGTKIDVITDILKKDDEIMELANGIAIKKLKEIDGKSIDKITIQDVKTISDIATASTKRKAIFDKDNNETDNTIKFIIT